MSVETSRRLPLEGIRILELGMVFVLPYAITPLAALGADVIKIEAAARPDQVRWGPPPDNRPREDGYNHGAHFQMLNRNKRGITLDLTKPQGREVFLRLVAVSDVVAENFTPRVLRNLDLTYERLREANERIILLSSSGFGQSGPWQHYRAYGPNTEAVDGLMHLTGYPDGPPVRGGAGGLGVAFTDVAGAFFGTYAILAALEYRERTGLGQWLDLSHYEAGVATIPEAVLDYTLNGRILGRTANRHPWRAPQGVYPCGFTPVSLGTGPHAPAPSPRTGSLPPSSSPDIGRGGKDLSSPETGGGVGGGGQPLRGEGPPSAGSKETSHARPGVPGTSAARADSWIAISVATDAQFAALASVLGLPGLADDPRFATLPERRRHHDVLDEVIAGATRAWDVAELERALQAAGVEAAAVATPRDVWLDPQLRHRRFFEMVPAPPSAPEIGPRPHLRPGPRLSATPAVTRTRAPEFGEHTCEVLAGCLGMSDAEIDALEAEGVIARAPMPGIIARPGPMDLEAMLAAGRLREVDPMYRETLEQHLHRSP